MLLYYDRTFEENALVPVGVFEGEYDEPFLSVVQLQANDDMTINAKKLF
jgi:hypothetical protein